MKKKVIIGLVAVAVIVSGFLFFKVADKSDANEIIVSVKKGKFIIDITTTGELEAKNSVKIMGPTRLRAFRVYSVNIQDIIDEGTIVQKGDWIATLDQSDFNSKLQDKELDLEETQSEYIQVQLDTTLQMRLARDELINLEYAVEEMQINLDQSQFEPPATIKQAEINLEKAIRAFEQDKENYKIKIEQNKARMTEVGTDRKKVQREYKAMLDLVKTFQIMAPEPGMVVYAKGHDGKPMKAGSQIHTWDPVVATLPDLSIMLSKTYINEVDVRKVKPGQKVEIGLDAFPDKRLKGSIIRVANVGEQSPNSDSKVFEATIEIEGTDPLLRPAMTTSNKIFVDEMDSALFVPLESLHSKDDSIAFVYKKSGLKTTKQEVQVGETNNNEAIIKLGLEPGERVYLSIPSGMEDDEISLLAELNGKRMKKEEELLASKPKTRTITLPDGTTREVTEEQMQKFGQRSGGQRRPGGGQGGDGNPSSRVQ
ncbi:MAG: efflux RND transporter periplasmic adaptor subunit [Cyclobacteriaceae bacterium]|nr:efflux RND transporter periplasmic adaptor subunit [Cyclobacteriaceae bacterium]MCK5277553.1 efflux RND transporter periplasmic adaptor subunit [Cyclobacteriaceae bacterium]MCK5372370.1 efflux RND transporter periplasmic adaptor subunit [Cyclobacteriaceae bacterium]MCK5469176.1 efflux RND transporter periplasmic adaptor subunit [Cyclobacteriaceae bacterium]MCK5702344.1 efflux RND transporter periplasmic adaptor subunit [Cyclobacteriaceae bacterium]